MLTDTNDQFLTENLNLNNDGNSLLEITLGNAVEIVLDFPILNVNIFKNLRLNLENNNYELDNNLFFFPYDWRLDLKETKELLRQKIEDVKEQTGKNKVNIIAHSMGGLLAKDYINQYGEGSVDKLVFIGTPHLGAPKAGKILLEGDRMGIPWLEEDRIRDIAQNSPALHELLPNPTYFAQFQGYLKKYSLFSGNELLNYTDTKNYFLDERSKNPTMFTLAENFNNQNLQNFSPADIQTYNITGCKTSTQAAYGFALLGDEIGQVGYTSGDGTVPLVSADYINIPSLNKFYIKDANHAELPSTNGVRELISKILNNNVDTLENNVSNDSGFCNFKGKKLTWHSPVEIHIYSSGNHTGPINDNAIEYGIPNIDYDVIGHNKFIFLPTDNGEEYEIKAIGLEEGTFDLSISEIDNGENLETQVFNDVSISPSTITSFTINDSLDNRTIEVKDGNQIRTEEVDATLSGNQALDLNPPTTQIILSGKEYQNGEFKKEVDVTFTSTDNDSGILEIWYSLDGGVSFKPYTNKFTLGVEGLYNIHYYSIDKAGNNEEIKQTQILIGKLSKYLRKLE